MSKLTIAKFGGSAIGIDGEGIPEIVRRIKEIQKRLILHSASLESYASLVKIIQRIKPTEVYHLGAQSYVDYSFKDEFSTLNTNINGTHYLLSAIFLCQKEI